MTSSAADEFGLERNVAAALWERAATVPDWSPNWALHNPAISDRPLRNASRRSPWALSAAVLVAALVVSVGLLMAVDGLRGGGVPVTRVGLGTTPPAPASPIAETPGAHLSHVENSDTNALKSALDTRFPADGRAEAIETQGASPVIFSEERAPLGASANSLCMDIATTAEQGPSVGSCVPGANSATQLVQATPDYKVWYVGWADVPEGTRYVVFATGTDSITQVPLDGHAYVTVPGQDVATLAERVIATAFSLDGRQLGTARISW